AVNPNGPDAPSPIKPGDEPARNVPKKTEMSVVSGPTITLVNEAGPATEASKNAAWKVNIPDEITGRQLKVTLTHHLQKLNDLKSTWSDDPRATCHALATEVLQALTDSSIAVEEQ